jgi:hypothetical protein
MIEFFKTFSTENVTCVTPSSSNSCEGAATVSLYNNFKNLFICHYKIVFFLGIESMHIFKKKISYHFRTR